MQWAGNLWEELGNFDMPVKFTVLQICKTTAFFNNHDYDYRTDAYSQKLKCHVQGYFCHCKRDEKAAQSGHVRNGYVRKLNNRVRRGINKKRVIHTKPLIKGTGGHHQWHCLTCWKSLEGTKQLFNPGEADANLSTACSRGSVSYHSSSAQLTKEKSQYGMS